jgi:hypothetical protein
MNEMCMYPVPISGTSYGTPLRPTLASNSHEKIFRRLKYRSRRLTRIINVQKTALNRVQKLALIRIINVQKLALTPSSMYINIQKLALTLSSIYRSWLWLYHQCTEAGFDSFINIQKLALTIIDVQKLALTLIIKVQKLALTLSSIYRSWLWLYHQCTEAGFDSIINVLKLALTRIINKQKLHHQCQI